MLRRKVFYLLLLVVTGLLAILYDAYIMIILFLLVLFLPVVLFGITLHIRNRIQILVNSDSKIEKKNKDIEVRISVINPTMFPVTKLVLRMSYEHHYESKGRNETIYVSTDANSEQTLSVHFDVKYSGNVTVNVNSIQVYDYLGICSFKRKVKQELTISILPEFYLIEKNLVLDNPNVLIQSDVFSSVKSGDDSSEIFSIHEYKEGDRINHIHWKLSLKEEKLIVKDFGLPIDCAVVILVELCAINKNASLSNLDTALEMVFSLSYSMILAKQQHYIAWYDSYDGICRRMKIETEEDLYEVFSYLFESILYIHSDAVVRFHAAEFVKEQYTNIFYVTPVLTQTALEQLDETKRNAWCHVLGITKETDFTEEVENKWNESFGFAIMSVRDLLV